MPKSLIDNRIGAYIEGGVYQDASKILAKDESLEVVSYLSQMANGLLGWYPFLAEGTVLQIGSQFGAFTQMLCSRVKRVTMLEPDAYRAQMTRKRLSALGNLTVLQMDLKEFSRQSKEPDPGFDYVIYSMDENVDRMENQEGYRDVLAWMKELLTQNGKMLFAVPNRYGLKYLSGAKDPATGIPFTGISEESSPLYRVSQKELEMLVKETGFSQYKIYYPLPDHHCTQVIYSEEYRPQGAIRERLHLYVDDKAKRVLDEPLLFDRLAKYDELAFFSNSFLLEAGNSPCSNMMYASVSAERHEEEAFATVICSDDMVRKIPLYSKGKEGLQKLMENTERLRERGIPVLSMEFKDGMAVMEKIKLPTLSEYIRKLSEKPDAAKQELPMLLQRFWEMITQSSEVVEASKNVLLSYAPEADWGPILKTAFIEMIPVNCFYDTGEFLFFDQEFTKENIPAAYIMYRALRDIYAFVPKMEEIFALNDWKDKFYLTDTWEIFEEEENRFQEKLRRRDQYRGFGYWVRSLCDVMEENRKVLNIPDVDGMECFQPLTHLDDRRIVLFGAGKVCDYYLEKFGDKHPPLYIVDNDESKWGTKKGEYEIKSPMELSKLMYGTYRVIIVAGNYEPIADQLESMGIMADSYRVLNRRMEELLSRVNLSMKWKEVEGNPHEKYQIGYVTGAFDLFHIGHLNVLKNSKSRCEYLIAGVLTDEIIEAEKHKTPFIPFEERLEIVKQCKYVDRVVAIDSHNTDKIDAWKELRFDCLFSGNDHDGQPYWTWLRRQLRSIGSNLEFFPYTQSTSSTMLQAAIRGEIGETSK